jgi:hypothetical protein
MKPIAYAILAAWLVTLCMLVESRPPRDESPGSYRRKRQVSSGNRRDKESEAETVYYVLVDGAKTKNLQGAKELAKLWEMKLGSDENLTIEAASKVVFAFFDVNVLELHSSKELVSLNKFCLQTKIVATIKAKSEDHNFVRDIVSALKSFPEVCLCFFFV